MINLIASTSECSFIDKNEKLDFDLYLFQSLFCQITFYSFKVLISEMFLTQKKVYYTSCYLFHLEQKTSPSFMIGWDIWKTAGFV